MPSSKMLKIVLDTNMFISALFFGGMVEIIIDLTLANKLKLYTSADLSKEIFKKLYYFGADEEVLTKTAIVLDSCTFIRPTVKVTVCRDTEDNFLLEIIETIQADYLITRDKDLLDLEGSKLEKNKNHKTRGIFALDS